jgi:two-component system chemotaxis response regulator CheY
VLKVVVVDDSLILRRNVTKMLTELGHKVIAEAKDGMEAVSCYRKFEPELMTMDITMPEMNGIEAVQEIKKISKNVKIIMITSHGQEDMVMSAVRAGASGYILKPVTIDKLSKTIEKAFPQLKQASEQKQSCELSQKAECDDDDLKLDDE